MHNPTIIKSVQTGAIAKDGKTQFELHDYFCCRHKNALRMTQVISEEVTKDDKILVTMGKSCPKCYQFVYEGEYIKDPALGDTSYIEPPTTLGHSPFRTFNQTKKETDKEDV